MRALLYSKDDIHSYETLFLNKFSDRLLNNEKDKSEEYFDQTNGVGTISYTLRQEKIVENAASEASLN